MSRRFRGEGRIWVALVAVAAIAGGAYAIAPAIGGGLFSAKKAKRLFYTKKKSDGRFAANGSSYSKAESDSRYPSAAGELRLNLHPAAWQANGAHSLAVDEAGATFTATGVSGNAVMALSAPSQQLGAAMRIVGFEYCYDTVGNSTIDSARLLSLTASAGSPNPGASSIVIADEDNHSDADCRAVSAPAPPALGADEALALRVNIDYSAAGSAELTRATLIMRP